MLAVEAVGEALVLQLGHLEGARAGDAPQALGGADVEEGTEVAANPFDTEVPKEECVGAQWVRPEVVLEIASLGLTPQKRLRQPSYLGVRRDLRPDDLLLLEETLDG